MDGVLLKTPQVFLETVAAFVVFTDAVVVVKVGEGDPFGDLDDVGATLPPEGGLAARGGHRLAVGATVTAGRCCFHWSDSDGGDGLWVGVEGRGDVVSLDEGQV